jgi:hypothetical protein
MKNMWKEGITRYEDVILTAEMLNHEGVVIMREKITEEATPAEADNNTDTNKHFFRDKITQLLGSTLLAGSVMLGAACAIPLEKRVITPSTFIPGRLVTLTGEVMEGYKDTDMRKDLNVPLVIYNSVDGQGNNVVVNIHEDFRFGINTQAIKRLKEALDKDKYAIRVYGRTTWGKMAYDINGAKIEMINVDADTISLSKAGDLKLILQTDADPAALMGMINVPINVNPDISFGFQWPWNYGYGGMFSSMNWFAWISDWGAYGPCMSFWWGSMWQDWDGDGIPNYLDTYPYWNDMNGPPTKSTFENINAGLNLHNYMAAMKQEKNMMIPYEGARLHPDFVSIFTHNRQADAYRSEILSKQQDLIKRYNSQPANARIKNADSVLSIENIAKSMGVSMERLQATYNNPRVRTPGMIYERGYGISGRGGGEQSGGDNGGREGYAIPSAGSNTGVASTTASAPPTSGSEGHIKK